MNIPTFAQVFRALHGVDPFPWQRRLADIVTASGEWPDIALPTAAGKTAAIDVALYHLAREAELPPQERRSPRRILFVVDRRTVVDDAFRRAQHIIGRLDLVSDDPAIDWLRQQLLKYGGDSPLAVAMLRGGVHRDQRWFKDPLQPTVIVSTVDQVGSRLLFRGYGCRNQTWSIHAALMATDSLFLLDEAHLSQPFEQTLKAIQDRIRKDQQRNGWGLPMQCVSLTATSSAEKPPMREDDEDRAHPVLSLRLSTPKPALLIKVSTDRVKASLRPRERQEIVLANRVRIAAEFLNAALTITGNASSKKVAIIVNEVALARMIHERLQDLNHRSLLVIGRSRAVDRWNLFNAPDAPTKCLRVGAHPIPEGVQSLFVVSTQCIEVGADLDFDHLITECAAIDALRQRFGRLARAGRANPAHAVIIAAKDQVASDAKHPVYGEALAKTWDWMSAKATNVRHPLGKGPVLDFSHKALAPKLPSGGALKPLLTPREDAPLLLDHHLECWNQTFPKPAAEPDVSLFLHGPSKGAPEVNLVWRELPRDSPENWSDWIEVLRPLSSECLQLPIHQLVNWLSARTEDQSFDLPSQANEDHQTDRELELPFAILRLRPDEPPVVCRSIGDVQRSRQGDTLVLPSWAGGCDRFGWAPRSRDVVEDTSLLARLLQRRELVAIADATEDDDADPVRLVSQSIIRNPRSALDRLYQNLVQQVLGRKSTRWQGTAVPHSSKIIFSMIGKVPDNSLSDEGSGDWEEERSSRIANRKVSLMEHLHDVHAEVRRCAALLGLPTPVAEVLERSALLHDVGKCDPEFQAMLGNNDSAPGSLLAKGVMTGKSPATRHEALSASMASGCAGAYQDWELLLHLISSHHGQARPFIVTERSDIEGSSVSFDIDLADGKTVKLYGRQDGSLYRADAGYAIRFSHCTSQLGAYHLALLETVLRLADWKVSSSY